MYLYIGVGATGIMFCYEPNGPITRGTYQWGWVGGGGAITGILRQ